MPTLSDVLTKLRVNWSTFRSSRSSVRALLYGMRPDGETQPLLIGPNGELLTNATGESGGGTGGGGSDPPRLIQKHYWGTLVNNSNSGLAGLAGMTSADGFKRALIQCRTGSVLYHFRPGDHLEFNAMFELPQGVPMVLNAEECKTIRFTTGGDPQTLLFQIFGTGEQMGSGEEG